MSFLIKEQLLSSEQHGFMPRKSTVTQLVKCISHWQWARDYHISRLQQGFRQSLPRKIIF